MHNYVKKLYRKYVLLDNLNLSISKYKIRECFNKQKKEYNWTFFSERAFVEELFCTRFNYFIATVAFLSAAITQIKSMYTLLCVVFTSLIIITLMAFNIYRVYVKLIVLLKILYQLDDFNALNVVDKEIKQTKNKLSFPVNPLIGFIVPAICILTYFIILIYLIVKLSSQAILYIVHAISNIW